MKKNMAEAAILNLAVNHPLLVSRTLDGLQFLYDNKGVLGGLLSGTVLGFLGGKKIHSKKKQRGGKGRKNQKNTSYFDLRTGSNSEKEKKNKNKKPTRRLDIERSEKTSGLRFGKISPNSKNLNQKTKKNST